MKPLIIIIATLLVTCTDPVFAKPKNKMEQEKTGAKSPLGKARKHLESALAMISAKEEGGKGGIGKKKANLPNIMTALNEAETSLNGAQNHVGTAVNVALKFIAEAKAEMEASKVSEADHLPKAEAAVKEALKRVMQAIQ